MSRLLATLAAHAGKVAAPLVLLGSLLLGGCVVEPTDDDELVDGEEHVLAVDGVVDAPGDSPEVAAPPIWSRPVVVFTQHVNGPDPQPWQDGTNEDPNGPDPQPWHGADGDPNGPDPQPWELSRDGDPNGPDPQLWENGRDGDPNGPDPQPWEDDLEGDPNGHDPQPWRDDQVAHDALKHAANIALEPDPSPW